jgi:hypothetical protein
VPTTRQVQFPPAKGPQCCRCIGIAPKNDYFKLTVAEACGSRTQGFESQVAANDDVAASAEFQLESGRIRPSSLPGMAHGLTAFTPLARCTIVKTDNKKSPTETPRSVLVAALLLALRHIFPSLTPGFADRRYSKNFENRCCLLWRDKPCA